MPELAWLDIDTRWALGSWGPALVVVGPALMVVGKYMAVIRNTESL